MRWPNRHPHTLTAGMRRAQRGLAGFLPLVDWTTFRRRCLNGELAVSTPALAAFGCGDDAQAVVWLLRKDTIGRDGRLRRDAEPLSAEVRVPGLAAGRYVATAWDTAAGEGRGEWEAEATGGEGLLLRLPPFTTDLAVAVRRAR
jgi:mannan endo-1,4-beta-mannosidase